MVGGAVAFGDAVAGAEVAYLDAGGGGCVEKEFFDAGFGDALGLADEGS